MIGRKRNQSRKIVLLHKSTLKAVHSQRNPLGSSNAFDLYVFLKDLASNEPYRLSDAPILRAGAR